MPTKTTTTPTFPTARAAKCAMTKAENAYRAARNNENEARFACDFARERELGVVTTAAVDHMEAVHAAATAQGFWVKSAYVGENTTRELILANID